MLKLLMFIGRKIDEALWHVPWTTFSTADQRPSEESYFKETEQDIRYEKVPEVTKTNQYMKSRKEQSPAAVNHEISLGLCTRHPTAFRREMESHMTVPSRIPSHRVSDYRQSHPIGKD